MFGFSGRRMKLGRKKVQLSDAALGTRSPLRFAKRAEGAAAASSESDHTNGQSSSDSSEFTNRTSGSSENWMVLSIGGEKPQPRFNHAAAVVGKKMVVVGGESADGLLEDVQVLHFDRFCWTKASSKVYLSPTSLPLRIPACKGHALVPWGKKVLLLGGKSEPASDRMSIWAFDTETECWSLVEAKGDIPVLLLDMAGLPSHENAKRRKLNDLHMFDLKSLTWLPLHCTGSRPSARSNHIAALYNEKLLFVFGGSSKSKTLNDLYSLDFEAMVWTRIKARGFHPSPRAGCCGALCGTKWYITGGGSKKSSPAETLVFDVLKLNWSIAVSSPPSSITTNKGFSLVLVQHNERHFLLAFGGTRKDPSNQVEVLMIETIESSMIRRSTLSKVVGSLMSEKASSSSRQFNASHIGHLNTSSQQNLSSAIERGDSGRKSLSESLCADPNSSGNLSLRRQFYNEENTDIAAKNTSEDKNLSQNYEEKLATLTKRNEFLEGQLLSAINARETAEKNLSAALRSREEMEKKLVHALKEIDLLKESLAGLEVAQEEANNISNIVHNDNVRLEHDVAFLKAVLDDTQKELHSTRGVLSEERARAFQLQVEVFYLKQRLQSLGSREPTPMKQFHD